MIDRLVYYTGRVQGAGFRNASARLAERHPVTGCVRNLPDGRVQVVVEGEENDVDAYLQELRDAWKGYIEDEQIETQPPTGKYKRFDIIHSW